MANRLKERVDAILAEAGTSRDEQVKQLLQMHRDARAMQRAGTESNMVEDDGLNADLREIDLALRRLGVEPEDIQDGGASTL